ncbi:hypothetical protein G7Y89_g12641 [Cudoniella acicularis]|uniref:Flavin-containing monooxygenase n=1 Tax=Cudoniella acicularis TaxID=354080 RepID=A0A8H4VWT8_9HELO|nr:hypothetical protein G7Y89_g12641 [Cudoniella acicularis]
MKIPDFPGLKEWKVAWPDRVQHSKTYRKADGFKDQNVLLIGAGVSAMDIGREISSVAKNVYQSVRGSAFDIPIQLLGPTVQRVAEISSFSLPTQNQANPGPIMLKDGRVLENIDRVILCTGYHHTLPFLSQFHGNSIPVQEADDRILVTDGTQVHNLHKDIFYIPDPTLAFVGIPYYTATFTFFEYQAIAVAAVFSGKAWLPSEEEMRRVYAEKVGRKGYGRGFHSLKDEDLMYVEEIRAWLNGCAEVTGRPKVEGYGERWWRGLEERKVRMEKLLGL